MHSKIKLLADKNIYLLDHCLPGSVELTTFHPEQGLPENVSEYDALFIRTVTQINHESLPKSGKLKLIASSSAGIDHIDLTYLDSFGITFAHAPGHNAHSVTEYICTALFLWAFRRCLNLSDLSIGVIGVGHVGRSLVQLLKNLGLNFLCYDPPRTIRDENFQSCSKKELLAADILTFHVPLIRDGKYATYKWLNRNVLTDRRFKLIINTSRGGVVDEKAVIDFKKEGHVNDFICDVWENEPDFSDESVKQAFIATPHIAGYSHQSKWRASCMITEALCRRFSLPVPDFRFPLRTSGISQPDIYFNRSETLPDIFKKVHPICEYDRELRKVTGSVPADKKKKFAGLRTEIPFRHEFSILQVPEDIINKYPVLAQLGFKSDPEK